MGAPIGSAEEPVSLGGDQIPFAVLLMQTPGARPATKQLQAVLPDSKPIAGGCARPGTQQPQQIRIGDVSAEGSRVRLGEEAML